MPAPTFLGIGAPKAGTTWLDHCVRQHSDVLAGSKKELDFFNRPENHARGLDWYEAQFTDGRPDASAVGEFTPAYLRTLPDWGSAPDPQVRPLPNYGLGGHWPGTAERVRAAYPDVRFIVVLRDPVDRAVSMYFHNVRARAVRPSQSVREAAQVRPGIVQGSTYATNLSRWFELFPRDAFLVLIYEEDVRPDTAKLDTLRRVFEHIGVDPTFVPDGVTARKNARNSPFDMILRHAPPLASKVMRRLPPSVRSWPIWDIRVSDKERTALADEFAPEVARLEELLGRDLPWLTKRV